MTPGEVTRVGNDETQGDVMLGEILIDDNFGIGGQEVSDGILASGDVTFFSTINVGGVARNLWDGILPSGNGYIANEANDPTDLIDEGGSWLINVVAGISDGERNLDGSAPELGDVIFTPQIDGDTVAIDDDFGEVPTQAPAATWPYLPTYAPTTSGNVISASGDILFEPGQQLDPMSVHVGVSWNTFTGGFNADGTPNTDSYGLVSSVNGAVDYDGVSALYDYTGDGVKDPLRSVGDMNIDFGAGQLLETWPENIAMGLQFQPAFNNINDIDSSLPGGAFPHYGPTDSDISVYELNVGLDVGHDLANEFAPFYPDDPDTSHIFEGPANFNSTFVAASDVTDPVFIAGNLVGRDGVGGRAYISGAGTNGDLTLDITVIGDTLGSFSAGMFVPFDDTGPSPLNPNDLGPLQAGTVLTLGDANISLTTGRWIGSYNGANGTDGINMLEVHEGTDGLGDSAYLFTTSIGATESVDLLGNVLGRPFTPEQAANDADGVGTVTPNPADGDVMDVSLVAFNGILDGSEILIQDSADFNLIMSNIDAITARSSGIDPQDPSNPSTTASLNSGGSGSNALDITTFGNGEGGLDIEWMTAALDPFVLIDTGRGAPTALNAPVQAVNPTLPRVPTLANAWGRGSLSGVLTSIDRDRTNGLEVGDIEMAVWAAGWDVYGQLFADDDIVFRVADGLLDYSFGFMHGADIDIAAGMNSLSAVAPLAADNDDFNGGNIGDTAARTVILQAGDDFSRSTSTASTPTSSSMSSTRW